MKEFFGWVEVSAYGTKWPVNERCYANSIEDARAIIDSKIADGIDGHKNVRVLYVEEATAPTKRFVFTDRLSGKVISPEMTMDEVVREACEKFPRYKDRIGDYVLGLGIGHQLSWFRILRVA